ncbi:helix-turn-helix domain-containing protein [Cupriavidus taiwanensis]|uniref:helix-turn-helix domain-containing protein n=1 Tax=Cupriavidus taiwanensis TaxID=164546 RepID=UPI000E2EA35C|nr:helix-turn-helix transcriptional regulator [Cupriavidus taiwanensis]
MDLPRNFGRALRTARRLRGVSQEALDSVSSRTYISSLERGLKSPTLEKVDQIAGALAIHPVTLVAYSYLDSGDSDGFDRLLGQIEDELRQLMKASHE